MRGGAMLEYEHYRDFWLKIVRRQQEQTNIENVWNHGNKVLQLPRENHRNFSLNCSILTNDLSLNSRKNSLIWPCASQRMLKNLTRTQCRKKATRLKALRDNEMYNEISAINFSSPKSLKKDGWQTKCTNINCFCGEVSKMKGHIQ